MHTLTDTHYMKEALKEAGKAFDSGEVPVGAVIAHEGRIIGRAHNQIKTLKDPTAHAEIIAITQAASALGNERLLKAVLYVTIEPCVMCAGAMVLGRISRLVFGARDPKTGAFGSRVDVNRLGLNHKIKVAGGVMEEECGLILKKFFAARRKRTACEDGSCGDVR